MPGTALKPQYSGLETAYAQHGNIKALAKMYIK